MRTPCKIKELKEYYDFFYNHYMGSLDWAEADTIKVIQNLCKDLKAQIDELERKDIKRVEARYPTYKWC